MRAQLVVAMSLALMLTAGCQRSDEPAPTPLPTRQTTIDPVTKKLDAAAKDVERRRQDIDEVAK